MLGESTGGAGAEGVQDAAHELCDAGLAVPRENPTKHYSVAASMVYDRYPEADDRPVSG
jgi:hypothetical protein